MNPDGGSGRSSKRELRRTFADQCLDDWLDFPDLPGRHLHVRRCGFTRYQLLEQDRVVATLQGRWSRRWSPASVETGGRTYSVPAPGRDLTAHFGVPPMARDTGTAYDRSTGQPVLCMFGRHRDLRDVATVELLPDRGSLSLPVRGSIQTDAIMAAVDEDGTTLCRMRLGKSNWGRWFSEVEVVVERPGPVDADVVLIVAIASINIRTYFQRPTASA